MTTLLDIHSVASEPHPWRLYGGRVAEFLLVGGATPLLFAMSWLLRQRLELDALEYAVGFAMFHLAFVINDPHFCVTYLLYYERWGPRAFGSEFSASLRLRYWGCGIVVPLVLLGWAGFGLASGSSWLLGLLMQLMLVLVGYHYVKQGFGVALVLARRRGVSFHRHERRAILAHCLAAWGYAWSNPATPARTVEVRTLIYDTLPRPVWLEQSCLAALALSGLWLLVVLLRKIRREGVRPLTTPLVALLVSTWAWSIYANADPLVRYMVPALHSLQYGYFVMLLKGNEAREREGEPYFEAPAGTRLLRLLLFAISLGFLLFHGLPYLLDEASLHDAQALGPTPFFAAFYAVVNIHHYFMDSVLWRGDQPGTRYLLPTGR